MTTVVTAGCTQSSQSASDQNKNTSIGQNATDQKTDSVSFVDGKGNLVQLPATAKRIIVLNGDCAELLCAIGAKDKIVGASDSLKNRPQVSNMITNVTYVGSYTKPDIEMILTLKPDVVINYATSSTNMAQEYIEQLNSANITVVYLDCYKLNTLADDVQKLGILTGKTEKAKEFSTFVNDNIRIVSERTSDIPDSQRVTIYYEGSTAYNSVGNGSAHDIIIHMAGGKNIAENNASQYKASQNFIVSSEFVIAQNPQVIVKYLGNTTLITNETLAPYTNELLGREGLFKTDAAKNKRVYTESALTAYGPRSVVGLLFMAKILYPDKFTDVDPKEVLAKYADQFIPGADKGDFIYPLPA